MRRILLLFLSCFFGQLLTAQVAKKVVVEHFTNTRCGICTFKNPQLFENLDNHPEVLHLSTHPGSPYGNCVLFQHNTVENDARTNFYGVYGSTPRIVIQGEVKSTGTNFADPELLTPYEDEMTPASISIQQSKTDEMLEAFITVQTEAEHNLGDLRLYVVAAEDTLFYSSPNGEDIHFNVFRKNLSDETGFELTLPQDITGEVTFSVSTEMHEDWVAERMFVMAILQDATTNEVIQAEKVPASMNGMISGTSDIPELENVSVFPNPATDILVVELEDAAMTTGRIFDLSGKLMMENKFQNQVTFNVENLLSGAYLLELENENGKSIQKVIVQ